MQNDTISSEDTINKGLIIQDDIFYDALDSMYIDINNRRILLYGDAIIKYEKTEITASFIKIDWIENEIYATGLKDSLGIMQGYPVFKENNKNFKAKEITYNFKTKKGIIKNLVTKEGEGFIHGRKVKKNESEVMFLEKGEYTTCDLENPHFSIRSNRIKVIPGKKIISGPSYLVIRKIPTPLFLPFGFFPNTHEQSSGVLIPAYGESQNLGFFLKNGGYYFNLNQFMDLQIRADIYTKGSVAARSLLRYKKRYSYNGNINLSFGNMVNSEKELPDYSVKRDFFIRWKHQQDPKANPSLLFSANVNAGSSSYHKNNSYNSDDYLSNTFQSSISLSKRWVGKPFNLSTNLRHSQNTNTNIISLTIPDITFSISRIFPFESNDVGKTKWYEKIGISYNMNTKNQISIADSLLFQNDALSEFKNGMKHTIPISTSIKLFKYFTLSPRLNLTERWYLSQTAKEWDGSQITSKTINKFTRGHEYNISTGINTKLYGIKQFRKGKIFALRHVMTPNLSFSYRPDFSKEKYGIYKTIQSDEIGNTDTYSIMEDGIYGGPGKGKSGNITLNLGNLFDMKIRSKKDTLDNIKKITLIESLNLSSSYNIFAESFNLSYINLNARTRILNALDLTFSSQYDPYSIIDNKRVEQLEIKENNRLGRFTNANTALSLNLAESLFNKEQEKESYNIPWSLNMNYNIRYDKNNLSSSQATTTQSLNFSGNINITSKWKIGFRSGYDFQEKELTYSSIDIYRDLHCWEMLFNWIPLGFHRSYTFTLRVKASVLKDLKLEKKKDWIDVNY